MNSYTSFTAGLGTNVDDINVTTTAGSGLKRQTVDPTAGGVIALSSPPANLTGGSDTALTFVETVNHVLLQNNSNTAFNLNFDAAASAGTFLIPANSPPIAFDFLCTAVHILCSASLAVNGSTGGNVVVQGRA